MKVRFLADYRGILTGEEYFLSGAVVDLERGEELVQAGRATPVEDFAKKDEPKQPVKNKKK